MNRERFEVPADGNCLFWSVAMAYLLPTIDNNVEFQNRFFNLFGRDCLPFLNSAQQLLKTSTSGSNVNYSHCYTDSTFKLLVSVIFRSKVINILRLPEVKNKLFMSIILEDFRQSHNDNYITSGRILTDLKRQFKSINLNDLNVDQLKYNESLKRIEEVLESVDNEEKSEFLYECYLQCMAENSSSWGGHHEILAMCHMLQCEIHVETLNRTNVIKWNDSDGKLHLYYNGTHYEFGLETGHSSDSAQPEMMNTSSIEKAAEMKTMSDDKQQQQQEDFSLDDFGKYDGSSFGSLVNGPMYQVKLLLLFLKRAHAFKLNFRLATEWKKAEKFDDLIFLFQDNNHDIGGCFLQAKHKQDKSNKSKHITYEELLDKENGDFSLKKYFISYKKMKENHELKIIKIKSLVIFTNIDFDPITVKSKNMLKEMETIDRMLQFNLTLETTRKTPTHYCLIPNEQIKGILRESSDVHQLAAELVNHVFSNPQKHLTLKTPMFKKFHKALCKQVIDKDLHKFHQHFIEEEGGNVLVEVVKFRHIFKYLVLQRKRAENKEYDENNLSRDILGQKITLLKSFGSEKAAGTSEMPKDVVSEEDIEEFFQNNLVFAVDQPNESELGQVIEQEVGSSFNLSCNKDIAEQVKSDLLNWFNQKNVEFITPAMCEIFIQSALSIMNLRVGIGLGAKEKTKLHTLSKAIQFDNLNSFCTLIDGDKSYLIKSDELLLTLIKIHQCVIQHEKYRTQDSHIFIDLITLLETKEQNCILSAFGALDCHQLLVIHCNCADKEFQEKSIAIRSLFENLYGVLRNKNNKKLLVVVQAESDLQAHFIRDQFTVENDNTKFLDLSSDSQTLLLDKSVKFQGNLVKLGTLIKNRSNWNEILDNEIIVELITHDELEIGIAPLKLSQLEAAFAKRYKEIKAKNLLNVLKLDSQEAEAEIFLFTENTTHLFFDNQYFEKLIQLFNINNELYKSQLTNCVNLIESSSGNDYTNCKKINIVLNETEEINLDIFKKICYYNSGKFVYWLEIVNYKFHWLQIYDPHFYIKRHFVPQESSKAENLNHSRSKNKGVIRANKSTTEITRMGPPYISRRRQMKYKFQNIALSDSQSMAKKIANILSMKNIPFTPTPETKDEKSIHPSLNEKELATANDRVIVLVAEPGMGKTTTLTQLSEYKLSDSWVIRLNLKNHQDQIRKFVCYSNESQDKALASVLDFLLSVSHENKANRLTAKLLKHSLAHLMSRPLLILFDGYDEISDDCRAKLMYIMKYLKESTLAKLWVSSRREHTRGLEKELGVLATTFKELESDERKVYLRNFYQVRLKLQLSEGNMDLVFKKNSGSFDVFFKVLLAKVDRVFKYNLSRFMGIPLQLHLLAEGFLPEFEKYIVNTTQRNQPEFEDLDVLHFYQRFINVKYSIYFQEKTRLALGMSAESKRWLTDALNEMHQRVALKHLFPENYKSLFRSIEINVEQETELLCVGILQADPFKERLEFTHRTFAEYFIAQFLLNNFRQLQHPHKFEALRALLMEIINKCYEVICMFLNEQITEADLSLVKFGVHFDTTRLSTLEDIYQYYKKLTEFILSFFKNKMWVLKQLDFLYILREKLFHQNEDFMKHVLGLMISHYDVVHACLVHNPFILSQQFLHGAEFPDRKSKVKIIMSAIKCYPKIIEKVTQDYYVEDLCDLFVDDEELCQLIRQLKDDDDIRMTSYEVEANELLEAFTGEDDEYDSDCKKEFQCVRFFEKNVVLKPPYKITRGRDLDNLVNEIDEMVMINKSSNPKELTEMENFSAQIMDKKLPPAFLETYEQLNQKLKSLKREEPNRTRSKEQKIDVFYILSCGIELARNKKYYKAKDKLKALRKLPINSLWFDTQYNAQFQELITQAIKDEQETLMPLLFKWLKGDPIISMHLFSIVFFKYSQYTWKLINSVECEEMKTMLLELLSTLKGSLSHAEIKKFARDLLRSTQSKNHKRMRKALVSVEGSNSDNILKWIKKALPECEKEFESETVLTSALEFLAVHGQSAIYQVFLKDHLAFLQQFMNCMKHFPRLLHLLMLSFASDYLEFIYCHRNKQLFVFIFDFVCNEFPTTATCFLVTLVDGNLCSPLSYAIKNNYIEIIRLVFNTLLPYPTILKRLILTPSPAHKTHLHLVILESDKSTLDMFLSQLSRDNRVREYVLRYFIIDEEDKYQLYRKVEIKTTNSLFTFLIYFKLIHLEIFKRFFLPADKSVKPAFYLVGERGLKKVMEVLLRTLKSDGEILWELLTWAEPVSGKTVLHRAAERGYTHIVDAILSSHRKQKDKIKALFYIKDELGRTPVDCAILSEIQIIKNDFKIEPRRELIASEVYITFKNNFGDVKCIDCLRKLSASLIKMPMVVNLILVLAKSFNSVELMMAMFENADLRLVLEEMNVRRDEYSYHLFYSAIERNSLELVYELIVKGYVVNCTNGYGYTPMMKAVKRFVAQMTNDSIRIKDGRITKLLMQRGADIYVNNMHGESAHSMAHSTGVRDENYFDSIIREN